MEPQTIPQFMQFLAYGNLPNGQKTSLPLLAVDEYELMVLPFSEWAPAPYNTKTGALMDGIMMRIGSFEDGARLCLVGRNIHSFKNRFWEGQPPLSASRWAEKGLDRPENFAIACEYLSATIAAFEYLNGIPQIRTNLRDTFNLISGHLQEAEAALNARRRMAGADLATSLSLTALWEEFIRAKYEVMTATAHSFVVLHAADLQVPLIKGLASLPPDAETAVAALTEKWDQLVRIIQVADLMIWMFMDGYNGYHSPAGVVGGLHNPRPGDMKKTYQEAFEHVGHTFLEAVIEKQKTDGSDNQSFMARVERFVLGTASQDQLRTAIRGSPMCPSPREPWIREVLHRQRETEERFPEERHQRGFEIAVYHIAHGRSSGRHSDDVRAAFESHVSCWGEGVDGSEEVKPLLKLHWFDDGIESVDAAKRHFQKIRDTDEFKHKLDGTVFLAIDQLSAHSYMNPNIHSSTASQNFPTADDLKGHVLAIDVDFDPNDPGNRADESPGYTGGLRILGNLVWSELYPMLIMQSATLEDLWPMAMEHPRKLYTGLTVPGLLERWKKVAE
ncbi:hypothetical protein BJY00DRAFT_314263 [Aspergillus carlsbadensis]|nr:hypothetical protein BJY00DRAFT_314263 [Aspergillus carlsbadensis]